MWPNTFEQRYDTTHPACLVLHGPPVAPTPHCTFPVSRSHFLLALPGSHDMCIDRCVPSKTVDRIRHRYPQLETAVICRSTAVPGAGILELEPSSKNASCIASELRVEGPHVAGIWDVPGSWSMSRSPRLLVAAYLAITIQSSCTLAALYEWMHRFEAVDTGGTNLSASDSFIRSLKGGTHLSQNYDAGAS